MSDKAPRLQTNLRKSVSPAVVDTAVTSSRSFMSIGQLIDVPPRPARSVTRYWVKPSGWAAWPGARGTRGSSADCGAGRRGGWCPRVRWALGSRGRVRPGRTEVCSFPVGWTTLTAS